jgi:hypothetical protein
VPIDVYVAQWKKHGRAAGPIRNQRMLDKGKPDLVVAFPGGRGTADMIRRAERAGVPVRIADRDRAARHHAAELPPARPLKPEKHYSTGCYLEEFNPSPRSTCCGARDFFQLYPW